MTQLKLPDLISIRKLLIDKLMKEAMGLRWSPAEYVELEKVNPHDLENLYHEVQTKLESLILV
jgi:hypothetical protein